MVIKENNNKKETVGETLIKKVTKAANATDKGAEAREVTKEWGKKFLKDIEGIINDPQYKKWDMLYIKILAKKPIVSEHIVSVVYGITHLPPSPEFKYMLYSYDRKKDELKLEWLLPQAFQIAEIMLKYEDGFDPFLIKCIKDFKAGTLLGQIN